jgi:hypothetical protein
VSLDLYATRKQKYQNGNIHRNLRVPTSKREGKLSNPHARAPRARDAWRKFTEIYGNPRGRAARAPCIDFLAAKYTVSILEGKYLLEGWWIVSRAPRARAPHARLGKSVVRVVDPTVKNVSK